jgi:hypothetical protein
VFFAPRSRRGFFEELLGRSQNDDLWERYGVLYDNSFLCAHFNLLEEMIDYVDSTVYNWQGFVVDGRLQVKRSGDSLVNCRTGKVLKIAHFAGVPNPDAAMCTWPAEVTSLLAAWGSNHETSRERSLVEFLGTLNPDFDDPPLDSTPRIMFNALLGETVDLVNTQLHRDYSEQGSYLVDREKMASLLYSTPPSRNRWNGLACGSDCLEGEEYNFLLRAIRDLGINTAVLTGTAETATMLSEFGVDALYLEAAHGPWLDRSEHGCRSARVKLEFKSGEFDPIALRQAIESSGMAPVDLLLVDVPAGTGAGTRLLQQLAGIAQPRYLAMHNARRDCDLAFDCQERLGLRLVAYLPSNRGFALLEFPSPENSGIGVSRLGCLATGLKLSAPRVRIQLSDSRAELLNEDRRRVCLTVANLGDETLSSRYACPVMLSYHWMSDDYQIRHMDGPRSILPFDILPGCSARMEAIIDPPTDSSCALLCITLVQEHVCWFDDYDSDNRLILRLDGNLALAA